MPAAAADSAAIRLRALDYLARREHSRLELNRKLELKFPARSAQVAKALDRLEQQGLLSDRRFAEAFVRAGLARGQGPWRMRAELCQRGIAGDLIDAVIDGAGIDWRDLAVQVLAKKFGASPAADFREKTRRMRFLQQRGFSADLIRSTVGDD